VTTVTMEPIPRQILSHALEATAALERLASLPTTSRLARLPPNIGGFSLLVPHRSDLVLRGVD
jgi:hypothetical protein